MRIASLRAVESNENPLSRSSVHAIRLLALGAALLVGGACASAAEDAAPEGYAFFEKRIRPVLAQRCYACHSAESKELRGKLRLDSREGLRVGGESGPALVPGDPERSLLVEAVRREGLAMPPNEPLPAEVIADFVHWVAIGAPDPRDAPAAATAEKSPADPETLWSVQPLVPPVVPAVKNAEWPRGEIDRFILARLEAANLRPSPVAAPHVLLRRLHDVLTGLPPTSEQAAAFKEAARKDLPAAVERVVDDLLASPQFGERWARHWLDLARYADVSGTTAPSAYREAWRYREYVIHAFNADKPYDLFVRQQLAGDLLPVRTAQEKAEGLVATGYLALFHVVAPDRDPEKRKLDVIDEQLDVLGRTFLGISIGCARCHDHKLDPLPTRDYYALAGIFRSTTSFEGGFGSIESGSVALDAPSLEAPAWMRGENAKVMGVQDQRTPRDEPIHHRGEVDAVGEVVPRGFPSLVPMRSPPGIGPGESGRLQLAEWIVGPENPLAARVAVNRVWHHVFGQGLVRSTDNFGTTGDQPSHPELLDHLALRFREIHRGSLKSFIKELLLTRAWRQTAEIAPEAFAVDPDNRLLWRANPRRRDAEALHDGWLFASGRLDPTSAECTLPESFKGTGNQGSTIDLAVPEPTLRKRAIYWPVFRKDVPLDIDVLGIFDFPSATAPRGARADSVVPSQGLFLLNSPTVACAAEALAEQLLADERLPDDAARIEVLHRRLYARLPSDAERDRALRFLSAAADPPATVEAASATDRRANWIALCHTLMIANEFLVVE